ncbi:MAG: hypothetical protein N4A50_13515 [Vallitalea sp.]|jgi:hypothetical protein|nr:hypothetical protein [Vallitalea sp.]
MYLKVILVILIFTVIGISEIVPLVKENKKKELTIYTLFFSLSFALILLYSLEVKLPQISKGIDAVVKIFIKVN